MYRKMEIKNHGCSDLGTSKPPLLFCFKETSDNYKETLYLSLQDGIYFRTEYIPHIQADYCWGCFFGWLMLTKCNPLVSFLFNPVSMETILLPPLDLTHRDFIYCVVTLPPTDPNCRVLISKGSRQYLFMSRPGGSEWIKVKYGPSVHYLDALTQHKGKIYALVNSLQLATIDIVRPPKIIDVIDTKYSGSPYEHRRSYSLITSCEELFILRALYTNYTPMLRSIDVWRMDFERNVRVKVDEIGGAVFLCGSTYAISYYPQRDSKLQGDHIYYVTHGYLYDIDVKDGSISVQLALRPSSCDINVFHNYFIPLSGNISNSEGRIQSTLESKQGIPVEMTKVQVVHDQMLTDYISCTSRNPSIPCLLFTHKNDGKWKCLDPSNGKVYVYSFPNLSDSTFHFAKDGWLILSQDPTSMFLFNPFTTQRLDLPDWVTQRYKPFGMCFSALPTSPDCIIFGIHGLGSHIFINFCHLWDHTWTSLNLSYGNPHIDENTFIVVQNNPIYYDGLFYCLDCFGKLGVFDPSKHSWIVLSEPKGVDLELKHTEEQTHNCYLAEIQGELFSVFSSTHGQPPIHVFMLDRSKMTWVKIESLGDRALFVSHETSFFVSSMIEGMDNKIYFPKLHKDGGEELVHYSMETGSCNANFNETKEYFYRIWIQPRLT